MLAIVIFEFNFWNKKMHLWLQHEALRKFSAIAQVSRDRPALWRNLSHAHDLCCWYNLSR